MEANQWLQAALEEYKSLRTESLASMANQQSTLRYGTAAVGVALGIGISYPQARYWILSLLVPILSLVFFALYAIEFLRMVRVGRYVDDLGGRINSMFKTSEPPPLGWEKWLSRPIGGKPPRLPFYWAAPLMFMASTAFSVLMSIVFRKEGPLCSQWNVLICIASGVVILCLIGLIARLLTNYRQTLDKYFERHNSGVQQDKAAPRR